MEGRLGVIDLGSNTFHLLIVEQKNEAPFFEEVYRDRQFIYLSQDGVDEISFLKINDAVIALKSFKAQCEAYGCEKIIAVGTEALRSSKNGMEILDKFRDETGVSVELIDGDCEAELIYKGTKVLDRKFTDTNLIMDIGGGSVEFIIFDEEGVLFSQSYKLGISVLRSKYNYSDPFTTKEIKRLFADIKVILDPLIKFTGAYEIKTLIGSSGPFEILESVNEDIPDPQGNEYSRETFENLSREVLNRNAEDRAKIKGMPVHRADLSKEAFVLMQFVMTQFNSIENVIVSPYALKEGLIAEELRITAD